MNILPGKGLLALIAFISLLTSNTSYAITAEKAGDLLQIALPLSAYGMTYINEDKDGAIQFTKSFASTMLATQVLKHTVHKQRPEGDNLSFPSGHTSAAFSGAGFLHRRYGLTYGIPAYIAASYVGWSRVQTKAHYTEDVIAGAALALVINHYFVEPGKTTVALSVTYDHGYVVALEHHW
jgi:membrane-associated phospholipid phosphatase